jgi:dipeptidyl aminopeptidase/acylaminoacyl peptidase
MMIRLLLQSLILLPLLLPVEPSTAQQSAPWGSDSLTVAAIMRDPAWMGHQPTDLHWAMDSKTIFFRWNPQPTAGDSLYAYSLDQGRTRPLAPRERKQLPDEPSYGPDRKQIVYTQKGDIFLRHLRKGTTIALTRTQATEQNPRFSRDGSQVFFQRSHNLYAWHLAEARLVQLTDFRPGHPSKKSPGSDCPQRSWLRQQEQQLIEHLPDAPQPDAEEASPQPYYYGSQSIEQLSIDPGGRFVAFRLRQAPSQQETTRVPQYLTASGYTESLHARPKVGSSQPTYQLGVYDRQRDSTFLVDAAQIPGVAQAYPPPNDYAQLGRSQPGVGASTEAQPREVIMMGPTWHPNLSYGLLEIRSLDFKDRWIMALDPANGQLTLLDQQHDPAWIDGPGIGRWLGNMAEMGWVPNSDQAWFLSEESGYTHLYTVSLRTGQRRALTYGPYEVSKVQPSRDGRYLYFTSNEVHPGERHFYRVAVDGGPAERLTTLPGWSEVTLSPDEKHLAIRYSNANTPWELYLQRNKPGAVPQQLTQSTSQAFQSYPWRRPEVLTLPTRDGQDLYARLYRPDTIVEGGAAVLFVHGAGYLQNAHKGWSGYFREYMFHNLLADQGYLVLDIDYRGSAGYGRDWRTDVYRHMGGKDLDDHVDAAQWLVDRFEVDPERIGIYGGSYGGFITLMAMFTQPEVFACGAALRPVTDWAHYNHPYTAPMLNLPQTDSLAYQRSSPIYHAEGLQGPLLICHGMVDTNVHFQDVVRLTQRLIELGKTDWDVAFYPAEGHSFQHASSWTDEYRRIYELFERELKERHQ